VITVTSNQLTYWRNQEEQRANKVKEAETHRANVMSETLKSANLELEGKKLSEDQRHNLAQEALKSVENDLKARGLDLEQQAQVLKLAEDVAKYGVDMYEIPTSLQKQYPQLFSDFKDADVASAIDFALKKIGAAWSNFTGGLGGKGATALF
jgi:hypothetical protein